MTSVQTDLLEAWRQRWVNRSQPYALQRADGTYRWVQRAVTDALLRAHLAGDVTLALSSTDARGWCRWLCLDVDTPDTLPQLLALRAALAGGGLPGLVEASRRGGHLWLFLEEAVPVAEARWTLLEVCEHLRAAGTGTLPAFELYPTASVAGTLGHPVRLPLGIHRLTGTRYPLFDSEGHPCAFTAPEAALRFVLAVPRISPSLVQRAWQRFAGSALVASAVHHDHVAHDSAQEDSMSRPAPGRIGTSSAVIRWVDSYIAPLDLLAELRPDSALRRVGQGYLGWCPFHDDRAPDALGRPGTPSFYVVFNRRHGWSWRCLSSNCVHSLGPMRHTFRLYQELLHVDPAAALLAALDRWPAAGAAGATDDRASTPGDRQDEKASPH